VTWPWKIGPDVVVDSGSDEGLQKLAPPIDLPLMNAFLVGLILLISKGNLLWMGINQGARFQSKKKKYSLPLGILYTEKVFKVV
jgi:hypothetical protein